MQQIILNYPLKGFLNCIRFVSYLQLIDCCSHYGLLEMLGFLDYIKLLKQMCRTRARPLYSIRITGTFGLVAVFHYESWLTTYCPPLARSQPYFDMEALHTYSTYSIWPKSFQFSSQHFSYIRRNTHRSYDMVLFLSCHS